METPTGLRRAFSPKPVPERVRPQARDGLKNAVSGADGETCTDGGSSARGHRWRPPPGWPCLSPCSPATRSSRSGHSAPNRCWTSSAAGSTTRSSSEPPPPSSCVAPESPPSAPPGSASAPGYCSGRWDRPTTRSSSTTPARRRSPRTPPPGGAAGTGRTACPRTPSGSRRRCPPPRARPAPRSGPAGSGWRRAPSGG